MTTRSHDPPPRIDWLPAADLADGAPGRIGMSVLPGKRGASVRYRGRVYRADLESDLAALRNARIARLVLLVDDDELARWSDPALVARGAAVGVDIERFPMPDGAPPRGRRQMGLILSSITAGRARGDVVVACMGGVGRTGTVVACALVAAGWGSDAAIARVREVRHPTAVETAAQERFVRRWAGR